MSSFPFRNCRFQLTHPTRSATSFRALSSIAAVISTHAPHAECDGVRTSTALPSVFQLTHPTRSATLPQGYCAICIWISTHAPHAECDAVSCHHSTTEFHFNSRTPRGVRRYRDCDMDIDANFNSRTPRGVRHRGTCDMAQR